MATTTPDDIWTPDAGDNYALTTDLAAMADTIQDALVTFPRVRTGTSTPTTISGDTRGTRYVNTSSGFTWEYNGTTWVLQPRVIGRVTQTSDVSYATGSGTALPGMSIAVTLPEAARLRATVVASTRSSGAADVVVVRLRDSTTEVYSYSASANSSPTNTGTNNSHAFTYDWSASQGSHTINVAAIAALGAGGTAPAAQSFMTLEVIE